MKIKIDGKEIYVSNPDKNIVEIAEENGIIITAPCFRNKKRNGCCKACVIEIDSVQRYACGTKPEDGMDIIYNREDLSTLRKERLQKYGSAVKCGGTSSNSCCGSDSKGGSCGCSDSSNCCK